jgi:hypothetical protein
MSAFLYLLVSLAFVGILYLLADAQCHLSMSERDYGDWVALPDEAKVGAPAKHCEGGIASEHSGRADTLNNATGQALTHGERSPTA